jgi:hypothetical protein
MPDIEAGGWRAGNVQIQAIATMSYNGRGDGVDQHWAADPPIPSENNRAFFQGAAAIFGVSSDPMIPRRPLMLIMGSAMMEWRG